MMDYQKQKILPLHYLSEKKPVYVTANITISFLIF